MEAMDESKFVILGGGMVAGYAAKHWIDLGLKAGELAILSADTTIPYERPPLSKGFLAGKDTEDSIRINTEDFYRQHGIAVKLSSGVSKVDARRKRLVLQRGGEFGFEKLILATGARPRTLKIPGANLENVFYLRTVDDSKIIRQRAGVVKRAVVIGGGFIAMEVAAVLAQKGLEVTMVLREERIWSRIFTPQMSTFFERYYESRGVRIIKSAVVTELGGAGAVNTVVLDGAPSISCELVVAGIGVQPVLDFLSGSEIDVGDGVLVNEYLETNQPGIHAAGDVANYQDLVFGKRRRVGHWDNAVSQGQYCAQVQMGEKAPFRHVPYFFSDVFDLSYEYWGDSSDADGVVHRGDLSSSSFSVWWLRKDRLVAAFTMNRPDEEREAAPRWIEAMQSVSGKKLADPAHPIDAAVE
jgi:NADPH-dependent 2,4-dienoyl-CoA reductase/sulfur reductase-like enzyme